MSLNYRNMCGPLLGWAIGSLYFFLLFPRGFISGDAGFFQVHAQDMAQYMSGYWAYIGEPWHFPLLRVDSINAPKGTLVTFLDSIPLLAFSMKLLGQFAPANPYGAWVYLCFALQGLAGWWAASQIDRRSWLLPATAAIIAVQMPALSHRLGHLSLMAHFLPLFAIGLYIRGRKDLGTLKGWAVLILCGFYINVYLTAFCIIMLAAMAYDTFNGNFKRTARLLLAFIPVLVSIPVMMGMGAGDAGTDPGFGYYSMNLLAPFYGGTVFVLPSFSYGTEGQYEGYNYLGVGLFALVVAAAVWGSRRNVGWGAIVLLAGCAIYALSNEIYMSQYHLIRWEVPGFIRPIFETFRASGRFFWLVGYALLIFGLWSLSPMRRKVLVPLVAIAIGVQWLDLQGTRIALAGSSARPPEILLDEQEWMNALEGTKEINLYPLFRCGSGREDVLPLQWLAARLGAVFNTGYISRYRPDCDAAFVAGGGEDTAYLFSAAVVTLDAAGAMVPATHTCQTVSRWQRCLIAPQ